MASMEQDTAVVDTSRDIRSKVTRLRINARGWLGWKLYDAGARTLGHRISPDEVPEPDAHRDALNACITAQLSEHMAPAR